MGGGLTFEGYSGGGSKAVVGDMMSTGDMGYFDEAGRLFLVSREGDTIVSGGENVYPRAVENALAEYPDIVERCDRCTRRGLRRAARRVHRPAAGLQHR